MSKRPMPMVLRFWPVTVGIVAVLMAWELYLAYVEARPVEWVWLGLCVAVIVLVFILRQVLREK